MPRYESPNRPIWIGALTQIRRAGECKVRLVEATKRTFMIDTSVPLDPKVTKRFELEQLEPPGSQPQPEFWLNPD